MDCILENLLLNIQSADPEKYEPALLDLRLIIERHSMNRYDESELDDYLIIFHDITLIDKKLTNEEFIFLKYFLLYSLFNFPDRATLTAKCIQVLFDETIREAICAAAIEIYMNDNHDATCELIFSIADLGDIFLENDKVFNTFKKIFTYGGPYSKEIVTSLFEYFKVDL